MRWSTAFTLVLSAIAGTLVAAENKWSPSGPPDSVGAIASDAFPSWVNPNVSSTVALYASTPSGFWRSNDVGQTWNLMSAEMGAARVSAIAADPTATGLVTEVGCGAYQTNDGGLTWKPIGRGLPMGCSLERIDVDVNRPGYSFASGVAGLFVTDFDSMGLFWRQVGATYFHSRTVIATAPFASWSVFAAPEEGGFFVSRDRGLTWRRASSVPLGAIKDLQPQDDSRLTAVTDRGLFWTGDAGESWIPTTPSAPDPALNSFLFSNWISYGTTETGIVRGRSGDWTDFSDGLPKDTAISRLFLDSGRHLCAVPVSGSGTYVYTYGYPVIRLAPTTQALLVGEDPSLHIEITPQQPEPVALELASSDSSVLEPLSTPYIIPFSDTQPLPFYVLRASPNMVTLWVSAPEQLGGSQTSASVSVLNSVPKHLYLDPQVVPVGESSVTLYVFAQNSGREFVEGSTILWNGSPRQTSFIPQSICPDVCNVGLQTPVSASDVSVPGNVEIRVKNPPPGGGISEAVLLVVGTGAPRMDPVKTGRPRPPVRVRDARPE
jgi:hypothetical protein